MGRPLIWAPIKPFAIMKITALTPPPYRFAALPQSSAVRRTKGFTLVEVLVAVIVLSIGLLGMAGMHITALRNDQSSQFRSLATQLAYEMADRMRANAAGVAAGNYTGAATNDNCETDTCTAAQMAGYDLKQWQNALQNKLPNTRTPAANDYLKTGLPGTAVGVVCIDSTPDDGTAASPACDNNGNNQDGPYAIKIWWDDTRSGVQDQRFVTTVISP